MQPANALLRLLAVPLLVASAGCSEATPTSQLGCGFGEMRVEYAAPAWRRDVLMVVEPELARALDRQLSGLVRAMVTGELDDVVGQDAWAVPHLRLGALGIDEARALWSALECAEGEGRCPSVFVEPSFARYRWAPHGYEDDVEAFVDVAMCLARGEADCEGSPSLPDEQPFGSDFLDVVLVTHDDLCDPFDGRDDCHRELDRLVRGWGEVPRWWPRVIAGVPPDLTTAEAWHDAADRRVYLGRIHDDPRMQASGEDVCAGAGAITAVPAPELVRALAEAGDGLVSICNDDYRPLLEMRECFGAIDYGALGFEGDRLSRLEDGRYDCRMFEVLPAEGPVTRCAQLTDFGRSETLRVEDGREVCDVEQLSEEDALAGRGAGFYLSSDALPLESWPSRGNRRPPCTGYLGGSSIPTLAGTQPIAGSTVRVHCTTSAGEPNLRRCTTPDAAAP